MSIANQGDLKDAISRWMLKETGDLVATPDQIDNYVDMAEAEIGRELLIRDLQEDEAIAVTNVTDTYALPADYNAIFDLYYTTPGFDLDYYPTKKALIQKYFGTAPGRPRGYTIYGGNIILGPFPDANYSLILDYFKILPPITEDEDENVILTKYPDLYLYGSLKQAQMQIQDPERLAAYGQNFSTILSRVLNLDQMARIPVGTRPRIKPIGGC